MQDRGTDANNSATRDVLLSQRVMLPGMRDGVMRSEDLTLTSARRIRYPMPIILRYDRYYGGVCRCARTTLCTCVEYCDTRVVCNVRVGGKQWGEQFGGDVPSTRLVNYRPKRIFIVTSTDVGVVYWYSRRRIAIAEQVSSLGGSLGGKQWGSISPYRLCARYAISGTDEACGTAR
eukprot:2748780-Rhodomonas_salina.1